MTATMSSLTVGDKVSLDFNAGLDNGYTLYDLLVRTVETDSVVLSDPMGPLVVTRTAAGWKGEGKLVTVHRDKSDEDA